MCVPPGIHSGDINIEGDIIDRVCVLVPGRDDTNISTPTASASTAITLRLRYILRISADAHLR